MPISIPPKHSAAQITGYIEKFDMDCDRMSNVRCGIFYATNSGPADISSVGVMIRADSNWIILS